MTKEELSQKVLDIVESYIEANKPTPPPEKAITLPDNLIVLSSDIFSKIVNILSYAENNEVIPPILEEVFSDIKENRKRFSTTPSPKRHNEEFNMLLKDLTQDPHSFFRWLYDEHK